MGKVETKKDILIETFNKMKSNFNNSIKCESMDINKCLDYIGLINNWCNVLECYDANVVLKETSYSMLSSIHIAFSGFYREAYLSIRSALESSCYFIYFVDNNYDYLKWKENSKDINWSNLKNVDNGILSSNYLNIFDNEADISKLVHEISELYRICSEYVHGKYDYMFINKFNKIEFNSKSLCEFLKILLRTISVINILLCIRFKDKLSTINVEYTDLLLTECKKYKVTYIEGE